MINMPHINSAHARGSSRLRRNETSGGAGVLTLALVTISVFMFTLSVRENSSGPLTSVSNVAQTIVSPLRFVGSTIMSPFAGMRNIMRNLTADEKTLIELKTENARLQARIVELQEAEATAEQLQGLLDLKSTHNLQSTGARVIAGALDSWTDTVTIDKGSAAGIAIGMPVVNQGGAVGQVIQCSATTSIVRLLTDEGSSVSAMVQSSRAQGMLQGSADGTLNLMYVRSDQTVNVGDIVVTGGLGGVFPKGIPIGKVSVVESSPGSSYYGIVVDPLSGTLGLEEVLVITSLTEEQEATAQDFSDADEVDHRAASGGGTASAEDTSDADAADEYAEESDTDSADTGDETGETAGQSAGEDAEGAVDGTWTSPHHSDGGED